MANGSRRKRKCCRKLTSWPAQSPSPVLLFRSGRSRNRATGLEHWFRPARRGYNKISISFVRRPQVQLRRTRGSQCAPALPRLTAPATAGPQECPACRGVGAGVPERDPSDGELFLEVWIRTGAAVVTTSQRDGALAEGP
jgi:hypothetical protein